MNISARRFAELDGLRGLAAVTVAVAHLGNAKMGATLGVPIAGVGRIAVWVFFVLSSFLLTSQAIAVTPSERAGWTWKYCLRRVFRIYPLFVVCLAVDIALNRVSVDFGVDLLTLRAPCCITIYWSIPPEFKFYFLIPFIGFAAARLPRSVAASLFGVALVSISFAHNYDFYAFISTFCFGSLAAIMVARWPEIARPISDAWPMAIVATALSSVPVVQAAGLAIAPWDWNGLHGALWATVVIACAMERRPFRWLAFTPLRRLGAISFPLYLTHPWIVALGVQIGLAAKIWSGPLVLVAILAFAWVVHRLVEEPCRSVGRRLERFYPRGNLRATSCPRVQANKS